MLKEVELPILSMFITYVIVPDELTEDNCNLVFYTSINLTRCRQLAEEINKRHRDINDNFIVRVMAIDRYIKQVLIFGFQKGRNTTEDLFTQRTA
jgi:hypothetical protein